MMDIKNPHDACAVTRGCSQSRDIECCPPPRKTSGTLDVFEYTGAIEHIAQIPRDRPVCLRNFPAVSGLATRLGADALQASKLSQLPVMLIQGTKADGTSRRFEEHQLGNFLQIDDGTAYFGVMFDPDRTKHMMDRCSPAGVEPWHNLLKDVLPDWPRELIHESLAGGSPEPHYNNSLVLSRGEGLGAPYHQHAPNLFLQVQGRKLWRFFEPGAFTPYITQAEPKFTGQLAVIDPQYAKLCASQDFVAPEGMPKPIEFVTEPNDMLTIPRDWMHATWSLTPYTAVLTLHADNDTVISQPSP